MKKRLTELVFILDKSGSMGGLETDTIGGFNSMLKKQREERGECRVTTVLFDNRYTLLHDRIDIRAVAPISEKEYFVGGSTALLDAIGRTIGKIAAVQKNTAEDYRAEKVIFIIITDGAENASREFSADEVKKLIEREKNRHGWEFLFLGANIDAVETAGRFGIGADRAAEYVPDQAGTALNYAVMSEAVSELRSSGKMSARHLDRIRRDREKRGG